MAAPTGRMTATERKELRALVEERFQLLTRKLDATEAHIRVSIECRLEDEYDGRVTAAEEAVEALKARIEEAEVAVLRTCAEVQKEYAALVREQRKLGIEPDITFGAKSSRNRWGSDLTESDELGQVAWSVIDIGKKIDREFNKVRATKGDAAMALREKRNEMLTDITLGAFQSSEARAFLDKIPTLDSFIDPSRAGAYIEG